MILETTATSDDADAVTYEKPTPDELTLALNSSVANRFGSFTNAMAVAAENVLYTDNIQGQEWVKMLPQFRFLPKHACLPIHISTARDATTNPIHRIPFLASPSHRNSQIPGKKSLAFYLTLPKTTLPRLPSSSDLR